MAQTARALASPAAPCKSRILIADDSHFFRACVEQLLSDAGAAVSCAPNGAEALRMLDKSHYDYLLLDLNMPVMGGREALQHIRSTPAVAGVKVIVMSSDVTSVIQEECLSLGADAVICKSFMRYDLLSNLAHGLI